MYLLLMFVAGCAAQNKGDFITFYDLENFRNPIGTVTCDQPVMGFANNRASSAIVNGTSNWFLYGTDWYGGLTTLLQPGRYPDARRFPGGNNQVSSVKLQRPDPIDRIVLFDSTNFRGPNVTLFCNAPYLGAADNKASSAIVLGNSPFTVYTDARFTGFRVTLLPGSYRTPDYLPGNNTVSSVRKGRA